MDPESQESENWMAQASSSLSDPQILAAQSSGSDNNLAFDYDATDLLPKQSSLFGPDDGWAYGAYDGDDQGDAKRRRIARACDSCRRKKIKCDAKMPRCTHCENYKTECVFTHIEKKRAPPKGAKYIEGLENRLGRMEHLLRLSGLLTEEDEEGADLGTLELRLSQQMASNRVSPRSTTTQDHRRSLSRQADGGRQSTTPREVTPSIKPASPGLLQHGDQKVKHDEPEQVKDSEVDDLADMMWCSLVTNDNGETRFIGSSSGFSIFSPKGVQWVKQKTGDDSFNTMINALSRDDNKWYPWREEVFGDIFARRVYQPLPPREECMSLMDEFFESFNTMFPLFHEPTIRHLVNLQYTEDAYDGSGWWASLNVALAIAYRIRRLKVKPAPPEDDSSSWRYFKNALAVLSELTMRNSDLLSVQALIGMCLFLQGTPNPQPSFYLIGAALRLAHSIGLHKHASGFGLNQAEIEQRKRVFWIAYMIDKDICLRSGRPAAQDDDDWNVDLPSEDPADGFGTVPLADGTKTNLFHTLCRFAVISAKVYNKLYSVRAARQSDGELLSTIGELDAELEAWKDSIPLDFRPEHELTALPQQIVIHIVILHFAYYNCLTTIHRRSVHHGYWTSRLADFATQGLNVKPLNPRVFSSAALCVSAARTSIHLIKYFPPGDYAFVWLIHYYPVSALLTIFANILQNPQDARARADLKLVGVVVDFVSNVTKEDDTDSMQRILFVCREFERIASLVLDKAEQDMTIRQKRKQDREREKLAKRAQEPVEIPQPIRRTAESQTAVSEEPHQRGPVVSQMQSSPTDADAVLGSQDPLRQSQQVPTQQKPQRQPVNTNFGAMSTVFGGMGSRDTSIPGWPSPESLTTSPSSRQQGFNLAQAGVAGNTFDFMPSPGLSNMSWPQYQPTQSGPQQQQRPHQFGQLPQGNGNTNMFSSPSKLDNDDFLASFDSGSSQQQGGNAVDDDLGMNFGGNNTGNTFGAGGFGAAAGTSSSAINFGNTNGGGGGSYQQPMIPPDLFSMPMNLEWDIFGRPSPNQFGGLDFGAFLGVGSGNNGVGGSGRETDDAMTDNGNGA